MSDQSTNATFKGKALGGEGLPPFHMCKVTTQRAACCLSSQAVIRACAWACVRSQAQVLRGTLYLKCQPVIELDGAFLCLESAHSDRLR